MYDDEEEKAEDDKKSDSNESDGSNVSNSNETEFSDSDLFKIIPYPLLFVLLCKSKKQCFGCI